MPAAGLLELLRRDADVVHVAAQHEIHLQGTVSLRMTFLKEIFEDATRGCDQYFFLDIRKSEKKSHVHKE